VCELAILFRNGHQSDPPVPCAEVKVVEKFVSELFPKDDAPWPEGSVRLDLWPGYSGPVWLRIEDLSYVGVRYCEDRRQMMEVPRRGEAN
jgi:hypothetical protein